MRAGVAAFAGWADLMPVDVVQAKKPRRPFSIAWHLAILAAAIVIPAILFGALMVQIYAASERERTKRAADTRAQVLMEAVDRDLAVVMAQLNVLAENDTLQRGDLPAFYKRASRAVQELGYHLVLSDPAGQQILNTRRPYGAELPRMATTADVAEVVRTERAAVSDVFTGAIAQTPIYGIYVPVEIDGKIPYVLGASLPPTRILKIIEEQNLPDQWSAAVTDSKRVFVARRFDHEKFVGTKGQPLPDIPPGTGSVYRGINVVGVDVLSPYYRSKLSGWITGIGIPVTLLEAPVRRIVWPLVGLALLLSAVAAGIVGYISHRTAGALKNLVAYSSDTSGNAIQEFNSPVSEVNEAATSINSAWRDLAAAEQALQSSDHMLRQALSVGRSYAFQWRADTDEVTRVGAESVLGTPLPSTKAAFLRQVHPDDRERLAAVYVSPIEHPDYHVEFRFQRPDGEWIWLLENGLNLFDYAGRLQRQTGIVAEFTDRKRNEKELARIAKSLRRALSVGKSYVYEIDLATGHTQRTGHEAVIGPLESATNEPFLARVHPDDVHLHHEAAAKASPDEPSWNVDFRFTTLDSRCLWLRESAEMLFDTAGRPVKQIGIVTDITGQKVSEASVQRSEARLRQALLIGRAYVYDHDLVAGTIARTGEGDVVGEIANRPGALIDHIHREDRAQFETRTQSMSPDHPSRELEFRFRTADGRPLWLREISEMLFDFAGRPVRHIGIVADVTESKKAAEALRESQALLQLAADAAGVGTFDYDMVTKTTTWSSKMKELVGLAPEDSPPRHIRGEPVHPDDRKAVLRAMRDCLDPAGNGVFNNTCRIIRRDDGQVRWLLVRGSTVFSADAAKRPLRHLGIAVDVTDTREAEETRKLLLRELSHRVKNTLATVQAIASQTSRRAASKEEFVATFTDRLQSMARAHTLLTQSNWQGSDIGDIVREQLTFSSNDNRIAISGPRVRLSAQYSLQLALVLHELGTNARKYGALSVAKGRLDVTWRVTAKAARRWLILDWQESGGPAVKAPKSKGFGTLLLERSFSGMGETELDYRKEGLVCRIRLPLELAIDADAEAA